MFNVVHGDKAAVDRLLEHPDIKAVSFVGSTPIARYVYETGTRYGKRVQALGGAKNHMLVLPDADLDLAADAAVNAGFGAAGERCMAVSVLVAVDPVGDELVERIKAADRHPHRRARAAPPAPRWARWSPAAHRDKVTGYLDAGVTDGATLAVDGRKHPVTGDETPGGGFWLGPTLFDHVRPGMSVYDDEIFGPVLSVVRVALLRRRARADQRQPVRQRHRAVHQRRRRRPAVPARGRGRHGRHQRADPGPRRLLLLRRLEVLALR